MNNKKKSLGINAFLNGLRNTLNVIFPLLTFPYVSRVLSVKSIGIYNFSNTYVSYFLLLGGLGISTYAVREGAKYRNNINKINEFSNQIFTLNLLSTFISYVLLFLSLLFFYKLHIYIACILIFSLEIIFTTLGTEWIYIIYEDYKYITVRSIIFKIISIFLLFFLVRTSTDFLWYAAITVLADIGSNILNFLHARSFINIKIVRSINWKCHLKPILVIFASSVAVTLYVSSDTTILGLLKNSYSVGIYTISVKVYSIVEGLISGLMVVTVPRLAMLIGKKKIKRYISILSNLLNYLSILIFPVCIGLIMVSREVIIIIAGEKYLKSVFSLQILSCTILFTIFSGVFNQCILILIKKETQSLYNTVIAGIVNLILNFLLIPVYSYNGAALSTVIAQGVVMVLNGYSAREYVKILFKDKEFLKNVIDAIIGCMGIVIVCLLVKNTNLGILLRIVLSIISSILIYCLILIGLKNNVLQNLITRITKKNSRY